MLHMLDISRLRILDPLGAAKRARTGEIVGKTIVHVMLDCELHFVRQLEAVRTEKLDAVILEGIMRGGDHYPEIGAK